MFIGRLFFWALGNAFALGTVAIVARVDGMRVDADGVLTGAGDSIVLDYVPADGVFPLSWVNGRVIECGFATTRVHDGKTFLYTNERVYETAYRLYELEERLQSKHFLRIAKSMLVNLMKIQSIQPAFNGRFTAVLRSGEKIIISRSYVKALKAALKGE